jgi:hypothetical protein
MPAKPYNGFPSWNQWNVSLWIYNDEDLYTEAVKAAITYGYKRGARHLARMWAGRRTPDGGRFNRTAIRRAIEGILD